MSSLEGQGLASRFLMVYISNEWGGMPVSHLLWESWIFCIVLQRTWLTLQYYRRS